MSRNCYKSLSFSVKITFLMFVCLLLVFFSTFFSPLFAEKIAIDSLMNDLDIVREWEKKEKEPLFVSSNLHGVVGYYQTPSARTHEEGTIGLGISRYKPYVHYYLFCQPTSRLELSGSYRIFKDHEDVNLTKHGFGDYADKGANLKLCLLDEKESLNLLPSLAIGFDDFLGSSLFESSYFVASKNFHDLNLELSLGYGQKRLKGFFGAMSWMPWRKSSSLLQNIKFNLEYDPVDYENDPHPRGREKKSPLHYGLDYQFADFWLLKVASVRGYSASLETKYPFGQSKGFLAKIYDPLPYTSPRNYQEIGPLRSEKIFAQELALSFAEHGLLIRKLGFFDGGKSLSIRFENHRFKQKSASHQCLARIISGLCPSKIERIYVLEEKDGLYIQAFKFRKADLMRYQKQEISLYELEVLSMAKDPQTIEKERCIYKKEKKSFKGKLFPRVRSFFGSASGKFKFELGFAANVNGFLFDELFYQAEGGYMFFSNLDDVRDVDKINPSQIINVHSDYVSYRRSKKWHLEQAFVQKNLNFGTGLYGRLASGYFQINYGGVALEALYYPVKQNWAIGLEYAALKKRSYRALGFQTMVRKLNGFSPSYEKFHPRQYFLDFYYDIKDIQVECKLSAGQFLAFDRGLRTELTRYFKNGMRLGIWHSRTNGKDFVNGSRYHDTGVSFFMPLDIFYPYSNRDQWGYAMSAWLRDVAVRSQTGSSLYSKIHAERS